MLERYEFLYSKQIVDLAFERAWLDWPDRYKSQFPQVNTDLRQGTDAIWVMTHATQTKKTLVLFWEVEAGTLHIYPRSELSIDDPDDVKWAVEVVGGDVPLDGWVSLATEFVDDYDRWANRSV